MLLPIQPFDALYCTCVCVGGGRSGSHAVCCLSVCSGTFPNNNTKKCEQCHNECIGCCNQVCMYIRVCICVSVSLYVPVYVLYMCVQYIHKLVRGVSAC